MRPYVPDAAPSEPSADDASWLENLHRGQAERECAALDALKAAAAAAGVDVPELERAAADPDVLPDDEYEALRQEADAVRKAMRGAECAECGGTIRPVDKEVLIEIRGWHRQRTQGGQNHVLDRVETGRFMCGPCAIRLRAGLSPQQEALL